MSDGSGGGRENGSDASLGSSLHCFLLWCSDSGNDTAVVSMRWRRLIGVLLSNEHGVLGMGRGDKVNDRGVQRECGERERDDDKTRTGRVRGGESSMRSSTKLTVGRDEAVELVLLRFFFNDCCVCWFSREAIDRDCRLLRVPWRLS